ncbi:Transmembrane domain-containing protein [Brazilian cedratvirus IHUMI]|uniref:Transmembrane domain-containing protein n=1 Tax=Brazilian cedratvirus IHUMI TaxID=2126980 RepID=A0A2R8FDU2_9VIRU|nr:Transmembrane domain-containing protein [Brazilian cedratvirus IHUMI]
MSPEIFLALLGSLGALLGLTTAYFSFGAGFTVLLTGAILGAATTYALFLLAIMVWCIVNEITR